MSCTAEVAKHCRLQHELAQDASLCERLLASASYRAEPRAGLLLYDVFWVFGSTAFTGGDSVMMTVATSDLINAPTRLLFPKAPSADLAADTGAFPFSLLGLGDVAVPGLLAGLCLRYDASRAIDLRPRAAASIAAIQDSLAQLPAGAGRREAGAAAAEAAGAAYDDIADADDARRNATTDSDSASSSSSGEGPPPTRLVTDAVLSQRRYFTPVMLAYVAGLGVAFGVNAVSGSGQPALLYLCPLTLAAVVATAASRRELGRVWSFTDLPSSVPTLRGDAGDGADGPGEKR